MNFTTISSWALPIWKALDASGIDAHHLFEDAGLDPHKLRDPSARYSAKRMTKLWRLAVAATADPCFGLSVEQFWHPTTLHALGYSWMASENLLEALQRTVRYFRIVTNAGYGCLEETPASFRFSLHSYPKADAAPEALDAGMAMIIDMSRKAYGSNMNPLRVILQRSEPGCKEKFEAFFKAPIVFSGDENALYLSKERLKEQLPTANAELVRVNDFVITEYLARFDRNAIAMRARAYLIDKLSSGEITEESLAKALNLSLRSFQRRLRQEGMTYKELVADTRQELAMMYIKNSQLSFSEITFLLGFSEPSSFSRAFKRWRGESPSEYRLSL
ncbi:MAG: AraC family transcriptional regulator [Gammaproteobacteria bacterium]|nr:AraC family transcriptional regulator [Gammaproteobacteria bacterium]